MYSLPSCAPGSPDVSVADLLMSDQQKSYQMRVAQMQNQVHVQMLQAQLHAATQTQLNTPKSRMPLFLPHEVPIMANTAKTDVSPLQAKRAPQRAPLGELPANWSDGSDMDDVRGLLLRERFARSKLVRMEVNESARLEMQLQNLNIKKNSSKMRDEMGICALPRERAVERAYGADGKPIYSFEAGKVGGMCVYFLRGFCSMGNRCRYVHDDTDDGRFVKITGMPYEVKIESVVDFFAPLKIETDRITFICNKEGRPSGSAIVEFRDRKEALMAQSKDRTYITEARYVLLYPSSKKEQAWHRENNLRRSALVPAPQDALSALGVPAAPFTPLGPMSPAALAGSPASPTGPTPVLRHNVFGTTPAVTSVGSMGLTATPSPLLQMRSPAVRTATPAAVARTPPLSLKQLDEDDTMRSLLSTLNEAEDEKVTPSKEGDAPPPLVTMNTNDWLSHLQGSLEQAPTNESIPSLVMSPSSKVVDALMGLGYNKTNCDEIVKALQEVTAKASLPLQKIDAGAAAAAADLPADDHEDMPTLLPIA